MTLFSRNTKRQNTSTTTQSSDLNCYAWEGLYINSETITTTDNSPATTTTRNPHHDSQPLRNRLIRDCRLEPAPASRDQARY